MTAVSLIKHETTLGAAIATSNLEVLNALTHPSFTYLGMHPGGVSAWTRSEWVNVVCGLNTISFVHNTPNVVLVGTTAVVTVDATWLGQISGAPRQQRVLMSDTWLKVTVDGSFSVDTHRRLRKPSARPATERRSISERSSGGSSSVGGPRSELVESDGHPVGLDVARHNAFLGGWRDAAIISLSPA